MSDSEKRLRESVSALLDGEADELEMHRLLKEVGDEQNNQLPSNDRKSLRGKWSRYNLASQVISDSSVAYQDIASAVSSAIDKEKTHSTITLGKFIDPFVRLAVAASVAMVAIFSVQQLNYMDLQSIENVELASASSESSSALRPVTETEDRVNSGPALQFPADFQPYVPVRTVSAGSKKTSAQQPMTLLKVNKISDTAKDQQVRSMLSEILEIHAINESNNGIQGMLPYARHIDVGEDASSE
jgi:sigma-E factor negative regulatory protein RseA